MPSERDTDSRGDYGRAERRRTNVIPDPQNKWLVDVKLQCCGAVIEDVRTDSKIDSTDTASGNGPTYDVCPDCGNWMVPFEYQNVRRLHQWCDDCDIWYLADEGHECEPELVADGGEEFDRGDNPNLGVVAFYTLGLAGFAAFVHDVAEYGFGDLSVVMLLWGVLWVAGGEGLRRWGHAN